MIYYQDYKIEIGFTQDGGPYWKLFYKGEPRISNLAERLMVLEAFRELEGLIIYDVEKEREKK